MKPTTAFFKARFLPHFLVTVTLFMMSGCGDGYSRFDPTQTPTPLESRNIVSSNLNLMEIWRYRTGVPNTSSSNIQTPPFVFIAKNKVIFGSQSDIYKSRDSFLTALALNSGEIIWQIKYSDPDDYYTSINSAYLDIKTNRLFLVSSFRAMGFDLETGKQLWITSDLGGHTGYTFSYEQGEMLFIDSSKPERITINPDSGQIISRQPTDHQRMTIFHDSIKLYNDQGFRAVNKNNQILWVWGDRQSAEFWPSFVDENDMLAEFGGPSYYLARFNYQTGQLVWRSAFDITSNYALLESRVFALTESGALEALDLKNGKETGLIQFDKKTRNGDIATGPFFVAISYPFLFTYFGDTQELIAFKFEGK